MTTSRRPSPLLPLLPFAVAALPAGCSSPLSPAPQPHATSSVATSPLAAAQTDPAWDALFSRTDGWNGGDIAPSLPLPTGDVLWLFGDSLVGPVENDARLGERSIMVRSAGALQPAPTPPDFAPPPHADISFLLGPSDDKGRATSWFTPDPARWGADSWSWLMGDGAVIRLPGKPPRLVLFASVIGPSGNPDGIWNFRRIGGVILSADLPGTPAEPLKSLTFSQQPNPLVQAAPRADEPARQHDDWGVAVVPVDDRERPAFSIFGVRGGADGSHSLLLARADHLDLDHPDRWRFFTDHGWSDSPAAASPILSGVPDEFTIHALMLSGVRTYLMVHSEQFLGRRILARTALRPEGPWSDPAPIWTVKEPAADSNLFTYAAKAHPELARPGEILVTYAVNSRDFGQLFRDASLYRPRFLRSPLSALPLPPAPPAPTGANP